MFSLAVGIPVGHHPRDEPSCAPIPGCPIDVVTASLVALTRCTNLARTTQTTRSATTVSAANGLSTNRDTLAESFNTGLSFATFTAITTATIRTAVLALAIGRALAKTLDAYVLTTATSTTASATVAPADLAEAGRNADHGAIEDHLARPSLLVRLRHISLDCRIDEKRLDLVRRSVGISFEQ